MTVCDQFFWATRVRQTGNGLRGPNARDITSEKLQDQLRLLLNDERFRAKAVEVARKVLNDRGFERVAERVRVLLQC